MLLKNVGAMNKCKRGEDNPNWKGDKVGYTALHEFVAKRIQKPELCVRCNSRPVKDLSCNGEYNRDLTNWEWLCRSCHLKKDGRDHKGEKNGSAKFTDEEVKAIRSEFTGKFGSIAKIARRYGVAGWTISNIVNGKTWKHVK